MPDVADREVAAFLPLIESQARLVAAWGAAEYDDLRQEGMIAVWMMLRAGLHPTAETVGWRLRRWHRRMLAQRRGVDASYDDELYAADAARV